MGEKLCYEGILEIFISNLDSLLLYFRFTPCKDEQSRHGVTRKRRTRRLKHTRNDFRRNLQIKVSNISRAQG